MTNRTCTVDGCSKPTRRSGSDMCAMHYHRRYRHGSVAAEFSRAATGSGRRYRLVTVKGHPIATPCGRTYEHRVVLYDEIGEGPHSCHWCGCAVEWVPQGEEVEALVVDHLDGNGDNNEIDNLRAACGRCNKRRAAASRSAALKRQGAFTENDTVGKLGRITDALALPTNAAFRRDEAMR